MRPSELPANHSQWTVDDVSRYIAEADPALTPYQDLFRKHVCTNCFVFFNLKNSFFVIYDLSPCYLFNCSDLVVFVIALTQLPLFFWLIIIIITTIYNWRRNTAMPLQGRLTVN